MNFVPRLSPTTTTAEILADRLVPRDVPLGCWQGDCPQFGHVHNPGSLWCIQGVPS